MHTQHTLPKDDSYLDNMIADYAQAAAEKNSYEEWVAAYVASCSSKNLAVPKGNSLMKAWNAEQKRRAIVNKEQKAMQAKRDRLLRKMEKTALLLEELGGTVPGKLNIQTVRSQAQAAEEDSLDYITDALLIQQEQMNLDKTRKATDDAEFERKHSVPEEQRVIFGSDDLGPIEGEIL